MPCHASYFGGEISISKANSTLKYRYPPPPRHKKYDITSFSNVEVKKLKYIYIVIEDLKLSWLFWYAYMIYIYICVYLQNLQY